MVNGKIFSFGLGSGPIPDLYQKKIIKIYQGNLFKKNTFDIISIEVKRYYKFKPITKKV